MRYLLRMLQVMAAMVAMGSIVSMLQHRSLFPMIFIVGSIMMITGLQSEIRALSARE